MLRVDLSRPDREVIQSIEDYCAAFGRVLSVKFFRTPVAFAMVEMASQAQATLLAAHLGVSMFGRAITVHLEQAAEVQ